MFRQCIKVQRNDGPCCYDGDIVGILLLVVDIKECFEVADEGDNSQTIRNYG